MEQMHPRECEIWGHAFRASNLPGLVFCRQDFQQFPFHEIQITHCDREQHTKRERQVVVEDLESECLQVHAVVSVRPSDSNEEGKLR